VGSKVRLRAVERGDLETLRRFVNDPEVMRFSSAYEPISDVRQERWWEATSAATDGVVFAVEDIRADDPQLIGTCSLVGVDWITRLAELRIRIGERSAWGQGLGTEACEHLLRYGFEDLNLERIWLRVYASNERAIGMYAKLGFVSEGRLRRAAYIRGLAEDVVIMGLLRPEWLEQASPRGG
jgi:RimJ/RimL family protein N-acetyltransferase